MSASINTNIQAQYAAQSLRQGIEQSKSSTIRLSSGNKITVAADDAAGLSIGTGLKTDVSTLGAGLRNTAQAKSILNIADGALANIGDILQRMKSLIVQSNSAAMSFTEKGYIDDELEKLGNEIDRIADQTKFNGQALLDGKFSGAFQVGFEATDTIAVTLNSARAADLNGITSAGIAKTYDLAFAAGSDATEITAASIAGTEYETLTVQGGLGVFTGGGIFESGATPISASAGTLTLDYAPGVDPLQEIDGEDISINTDETYTLNGSASFANITSRSATVSDTYLTIEVDSGGTKYNIVYAWDLSNAADAVDTAINDVKSARASVGAVQARFNSASANLETTVQNTDAARAVYLDADIASESSAFANAQVKIQAGITVLARANQLTASLLTLMQ